MSQGPDSHLSHFKQQMVNFKELRNPGKAKLADPEVIRPQNSSDSPLSMFNANARAPDHLGNLVKMQILVL